MDIFWLGRSPYRPTWDLQERLRQRVLQGGPEALLLCEHDPVITLGRSASEGDVLADAPALSAQGIEEVRTSRGGQVTYHGPGQLVAYPIVRLHRGVLRHVIGLGEAAAEVAGEVGVPAAFRRDPVGVYVQERKLAAIGVQVRRRVAIHGLALNVTTEATGPFRRALFLPCGESGRQVTSLQEERDGTPPPASPVSLTSLVGPLSRALCRALALPVAPVVSISTLSLISSLPPVE